MICFFGLGDGGKKEKSRLFSSQPRPAGAAAASPAAAAAAAAAALAFSSSSASHCSTIRRSCSPSSLKLGLRLGTGSQLASIRCLHSGSTQSGTTGVSGDPPIRPRTMSCGVSVACGGFRTAISQRTTPRDHTSAFSVTPSGSATSSGDI